MNALAVCATGAALVVGGLAAVREGWREEDADLSTLKGVFGLLLVSVGVALPFAWWVLG